MDGEPDITTTAVGLAKQVPFPAKSVRAFAFVTWNFSDSKKFVCLYAQMYPGSLWHVSLPASGCLRKATDMKEFEKETDMALKNPSYWTSNRDLVAEHVHVWAWMALASVGVTERDLDGFFRPCPLSFIFLKMYDHQSKCFLTTSLDRLCSYAKGVPPLFVTALEIRDYQQRMAFFPEHYTVKLRRPDNLKRPSVTCGICFMVPNCRPMGDPYLRQLTNLYNNTLRRKASSLKEQLCALYIPRIDSNDGTVYDLDVVFVQDVLFSEDDLKIPIAYLVFSTSQRKYVTIDLHKLHKGRLVFVCLDTLTENKDVKNDIQLLRDEYFRLLRNNNNTCGTFEWMGAMSCLTLRPNEDLSHLLRIHVNETFHYCYDIQLVVPFPSDSREKENALMKSMQVFFMKVFRSCLTSFLIAFNRIDRPKLERALYVEVLGTPYNLDMFCDCILDPDHPETEWLSTFIEREVNTDKLIANETNNVNGKVYELVWGIDYYWHTKHETANKKPRRTTENGGGGDDPRRCKKRFLRIWKDQVNHRFFVYLWNSVDRTARGQIIV